MKLLLTFFICINYLFAIDIGNINIKNDQNIMLISQDINNILKSYKIKSEIKTNNNSIEAIKTIINNTSNNYFSIVNSDVIKYYNKDSNQSRSIYSKIPAILSLGEEQLHIFTNQNNEFEFDIKKDYKVYCGNKESDSCISAHFIENIYEFNFTYVDSSFETIQEDLKTNNIDLFISVKKAPYIEFEEFTSLKLIDLPTNFNMEDMYISKQLKSNMYKFLDNDIHIYSVKQVLITNLKEDKYKSLINNIIKVIVLNKDYLIKSNTSVWSGVDFSYTKYKKFLKSAKETILRLDEKQKQSDAMKF